MAGRGSRKGERRGGRKAGTPNKTTVAAREAFQQAFEGVGGVEGLIKWANNHQSEFYRIYSRLIPVELKANVGITRFEPLVIRGVES